MANNYSLEGVNEVLSLGKKGVVLNGGNLTSLRVTNNDGVLATVQGADAQSASDFLTKGQFDLASSVEKGTIVIDYSTKPIVQGFTSGQTKYFDLTTGSAMVKSKVLSVPPSTTSYDGSDARTYVVDTTNGLLIPNPVDKQIHVWTVLLDYANKGGSINDEDIGVVLELVEYNGSTEVDVIPIEQMCANGNRSGSFSASFRTNSSVDTIGVGKGWKLRITSKEADSNFNFSISQIRRETF